MLQQHVGNNPGVPFNRVIVYLKIRKSDITSCTRTFMRLPLFHFNTYLYQQHFQLR